MRNHSAIWLIATTVALAACSSDRIPTTPAASPQFDISDGAHSEGNPHFFFLPPLVANPAQSPNYGTAAFNPLLQPVVRVFALPEAVACDIEDPAVLGPVVAARDPGAEQYKFEWDTRASGLTDGVTYRICAFGSETGEMLGFVDVSPVAGGMKKLATNDTYAFQDGRTLPIKFRIEQGALCTDPQDCAEFTVGSTGGDFTVPSKHAGLSVPEDAVADGDVVTVVVEREDPQYDGKCLPTDLVQSKGCYHFRSEPALYQFEQLVRLEACVNVEDLTPPQQAALRLYKYNATEGLTELAPAAPTLIDCSGFTALAEPAESQNSTFADAVLRDVGRWADQVFGPRALYARPLPTGVPMGLGGLGGSFSDVGGAVPETGLPDLVVSSVDLQSTQVNPGGLLTFSYTVGNAGGEGPEGNSTFDVAVYLSSDQVLDDGDVQYEWAYSAWTYHLSVGWSHTKTVQDQPIPDDLQPGTYYLIVVADAFPGQPPNYYPGVTEANETNNWRASAGTVTVVIP